MSKVHDDSVYASNLFKIIKTIKIGIHIFSNHQTSIIVSVRVVDKTILYKKAYAFLRKNVESKPNAGFYQRRNDKSLARQSTHAE